jgi:phage gp29-like protein
LALGRNIALAELVWESQRSGPVLVDIVPVEFTRIALGELDEPRILTKQEPLKGVALPPNKFIVHTPHSTSGHPSRGGLLRVSALAFLGKQFALKDWLVFGEVFGMPVRIARYEPSATPQEKRELLDMLQSLGSDAAGIFSKAVELEFAEPKVNAGPSPYESICNFLNREMSKAWLGQTLTVETVGQSSAFAAADVHDRVRRDLLEDDIRKEGRTLRRDLLRPLSQLGFGRDVPVPFFRRKLEAPRDMRELVDVLSTAVNRLGLKVPQRWAHDVLGIPEPGDAEDVLEATDASSPVA